ncbi:MAG: MarC family protein [Acetobacteraceae bacterium]
MDAAVHAFLLGFPALFSIVNPISGAFIFGQMTAYMPVEGRERLARKVALYSLLVLMGSLWAGSFVLAFFGITLAALRVAGGLVVALTGWNLLNRPDHHEDRNQHATDPVAGSDDIAMFPLTMPITTGPGTISVAIALSSSRPTTLDGFAGFFFGMTGVALALALLVWITYRSTDRIERWMGPSGSRTVTRLSAFLLLCIGVQILITGVEDVLGPLLHTH